MAQFRPLAETKFINDANLIAYWKFNESSGNATDYSVNNLTAVNNSVSYSAGKFGNGADFNSSYFEVTHNAVLSLTNNWTFSLWFKPANLTQTNCYLFNKYNNKYAILWEYTNNQVEMYSGGGDFRTGSGMTIPDTDYHMVTYTFNGTTLNGYIDGKIIVSLNKSGLSLSTSTSNLFIGADSTDKYNPTNAQYDDFAIFSRALSAGEVAELYQSMTLGEYLGAGPTNTKLLLHLNGSSADSSGNGNNGTDTAITYVDGKFGKCASFNGSTSKITLPNTMESFGTNPFTISVWMKSSATGAWGTLFNRQTATYPYIGLYKNTSNVARFYIRGTENNAYDYAGTTNIVNNNWHLITLTSTGSNGVANLYVDGKLDRAQVSLGATTLTLTGTPWIGANDSSEFYTGLIDEVIIEPTAWSAEKIKRYYTYSKGRFGII